MIITPILSAIIYLSVLAVAFWAGMISLLGFLTSLFCAPPGSSKRCAPPSSVSIDYFRAPNKGKDQNSDVRESN
jgi:hypothetical protein